MKVLIISNAISGGGAERSMRILNAELNNKNYSSILVCLNKSDNDAPFSSELILNRKWKTSLIGTLHNFSEFVKVCKTIQPDALIVNCELPELYTAISPFKPREIICVEHTSKPWADRRMLGRVVRLILLFRKARWVTVNRTESRVWPYRNKAMHIGNPVESPQLSVTNAPTEPFVFIGRLREEKGIRVVLDAITNCQQKISVYGTGTLEDELRFKFAKIASFNGFVDRPWQFISPLQTIIINSDYEGDGIVVVEAILAGVPILLRDIPDLRRFNLSDVSYFQNQEDLESKIQQAIMNADVFRADRATRNALSSERSLEKVFLQWRKLLD